MMNIRFVFQDMVTGMIKSRLIMFDIIKQKALFALLLLSGAIVLLLSSGQGLADEEHERARELMTSGEILPLEQVLTKVKGERSWRLLEAELEKEDGIWIYEFELVDEQGRVRELEVDARNGEILKEEIE